MNAKKTLSMTLAAAMAAGLLAGCGGSSSTAASSTSTSTESKAESTAASTEATTDAAGKVYYLNFKPEQDEAWQNLAKKYTEETGVPVTVVTAASGQYETTLMSEMAKSDAPTLFQVNGPVGLANWKDYCYDLTGTKILGDLTSDSYALKDGDATLGVGYVIESYGLITNKALLEKAGYTVGDIKSFDDLWKELQTHADTGLLGTFDNLYTAVKNKDWKSIGLWAANAIYGGLTADQKKKVHDFALGLVDKLNEALGNAQTALVQKGIDIGAQICKGLTSGFGEVWTQAKTLGTQLTGIFQGLKAPLSNAALAISQGLSGGLLSSFPAIYAGVGSMVGTIGAAFEGMMTAIASALNATVFGIPMGVIVAGAAVALGVAIAAICASLGASRKGTPRPGGGSASGGSGSGSISGDIDISTGTGSLEDAINANTKALEKTNAALADMIRQAGTLVLSDNMRLGSTVAASGTARVAAAANSYNREGDTNITQNFYNGHDTAAAQQREARWEADTARRQRR